MTEKLTTYRLGSSPMIYAPGVVAWAINGYHIKKQRKAMVEVLTMGWHVPRCAAIALLSKKVSYIVDGDVVVFHT